ncbi:DUF4349 domain-containing protein [Streptosporangium sp. NPDC000396]|uniref:DUF4349 domain-containing protein n=1 Tax=Streptosporangium sp. NPDC000396 TaxID=3366185 RepID=UPI0036AFE6E5
MSRFRYGLRLAAPLAGLALVVSACGGSASVESASAPALAPAAPADAGGGAQADYQQEADAGKRAPASDSQGKPAQAEQVKLVPQDRAIIYTAEMTVRAKDVAAASDKARQIVTTAGGHLATEKSDAFSRGEGSASLVFKIPPQAYPGVLDRLGKDLGTRESLQQNTEDVTEQVADVESRVRSAQATLDSLRTLLKKADTIGEVLEVEREISGRESELEALQARQKSLASRTSLATLTLNLIGPAVVVPEIEEEPSGFLGGLRSGWKAFVTAVKIGLTVLGVLLPWLVAAGLLWLLVAFLLRLRRRRNDAWVTTPSSPARSGEPEKATDPVEAGRQDETGRRDETGRQDEARRQDAPDLPERS